MRSSLWVGGFLLLFTIQAHAAGPLRAFGDTRFGYFASEREARDGSESEADDFRIRLRLGVEAELSPAWLARGRVAGRFSDEQDRTRFWLKAWAPTPTGLELGDSTIDELYLQYSPAGGKSWLRVGRLQTKFELGGVAAKSLDRNDSPSTDISWTDGLHWRYQVLSGWQSHLILQRNVSQGTGTTARPPLEFDDSGSRLSLFAGLESTTSLGPVKQRMISVTWMPSSLATEGVTEARREDYVAITGRLGAEWPLGTQGLRLGLGGELGFAANTPREAAVNAGTVGDAGRTAGQASVNLLDFAPGHGLALVYGWADAGWLLSPDFRSNDELLELRYQWKFTGNWSMEARIRRRKELDVPASALQRRVDDDLYIRLTGKF
jgi:hypothetical protein